MTMKQSLKQKNPRFNILDFAQLPTVLGSLTLPNLFLSQTNRCLQLKQITFFLLKQITLYEFSCWLPVGQSGHFGRNLTRLTHVG